MNTDQQKQIEWERGMALECRERCYWALERLAEDREMIFDIGDDIEALVWLENPPGMIPGTVWSNGFQAGMLTLWFIKFSMDSGFYEMDDKANATTSEEMH